MADEKIRKAADRDADAALEEILREVEAAPRKPKRPREDDGLDFVKTGTPRSHAATPKTPVRAQAPEPKTEAPVRTRSNAPTDGQQRRPAAQRPASGGQRRDVEHVDAPKRQRPEGQQRPRTQGNAQRPQGNAGGQRPQRAQGSGQRPQGNGSGNAQRTNAQRSGANGAQRPQNPQRSAAANRQPAQNRSGNPQRAHASGTANRPAHRKSSAAARRRPNYFRIGLAIYIMLGIILTLWGMRRLRNFLKEYEDSRPQYTIDGYVTSLNSGFYSDMVRKKVDEIQVTQYESADTIASTLNIDNESNTGYTWVKKVDEYTDDKPVYYIRLNGASIAKVSLSKAGSTPKFDFPVWKASEPESLIEISTDAEYSLEAIVPDGGSLMVNGIKVPMETAEDVDYEMQLDDVTKNVVESPVGQSVKISGLFVAPEVKAFDDHGNALEPKEVPAQSEKEQKYVFIPASETEPNPNLVERLEELTKAYINYMINKDEATWANRQYLDNFVLNGSNAFDVLHGITGDVAWNNPYTARVDKVLEISNVKMYSDTICTADAHFELQLTKDSDNGSLTNDYNGTVRWLMVKNGNAWYATHFDLLNDQNAENTTTQTENAPEGEAPAEDAAPAEEQPVEEQPVEE